MAIRGSEAKINVAKKIAEAFGEDFIGEFDKKYYVWAKDGAEQVQICIALTCPKNMVGGEAPANAFDTTSNPVSVDISDEERKNIQVLMERLGL